MNLGHLSSYLQVERIVLDIRIVGVVSILSLICKFRITVEFSSARWSDKPSGTLMRHREGIATAGSFDGTLTTPFKRGTPG